MSQYAWTAGALSTLHVYGAYTYTAETGEVDIYPQSTVVLYSQNKYFEGENSG